MGPGSGSGNNDSKPHISLNRDQELAISAAVETFEKRCDEVWKMRENLCEQVKQTRVSRGSELENMRSFIQVCTHKALLIQCPISLKAPLAQVFFCAFDQ